MSWSGIARRSTAVKAIFIALPQGPSLRSRLFCPGPSSLNRPHPPRSRAHLDFTSFGLYKVPLLGWSAQAAREWFRAFADRSFLTCRLQRSRRVYRLHSPSSFADNDGLRLTGKGSTLSMNLFRDCLLVRLRYNLSSCSPFLRRTFTSGLSDRLVTLACRRI